MINRNIECLPKDNMVRNRVLDKISFLYFGIEEDKELKLGAFLDVLVSYHNISVRTLAKIAGVSEEDIDKVISDPNNDVSLEEKYKIATTVMWLRFFLKDNEPVI